MNFKHLFDSFEEYFSTHHNRSKYRKTILLHTKNYIENFDYSIQRRLLLLLKFVFVNFLEYFKSKVKRRPALYRKVGIVKINFNGKLLGNFINGTFVIIEKNKVIKFYFKDIELYKKIYLAIDFGKMHISEGKVVLEMDKYTSIPTLKPEMLESLNNLLYKISAELSLHRDDHLFQPEYKIKQLFSNNNYPMNQDYTNYLNLCRKLQLKAMKYGVTACHGDLWYQNIMLSKINDIILIDYDKVMWFCPGYDFVYLYMMENIFNKSWRVDKLLAGVESNYSEYIKMKYPHLKLDLFKLNASLIILIKALELDLSQGKVGYSLRYFND